MSFQPYQSCKLCSGKAQPGTVATMKYSLTMFPWASSLGVYNCRNVAGSTTKSQHSCGRAGDIGIPVLSNGRANTALGHLVVKFLIKYSTELGITQIIYDRVIYDAKTPNGRYYGGVHPHYDHVHFTQRSEKATSLTFDKIVAFAGLPQGEDYMFTAATPGPNPAVAMYQRNLITLGYDLGDFDPIQDTLYPKGADGWFRTTAIEATKVFQKNLGLPVTGNADAMTVATAADLVRFTQRGTSAGVTLKQLTDAIKTHAGNPDAHHA